MGYEYVAACWDPDRNNHIESLEMVQKKATKIVHIRLKTSVWKSETLVYIFSLKPSFLNNAVNACNNLPSTMFEKI